MPRVVPSQVVQVIDQWFTLKTQKSQEFALRRGHAGQLMAIIELVEQIPQQLIMLDSQDYNALVIGLSIIRSAFPQWQLRDYDIRGVPGYDGVSPIRLIREAQQMP
jgi:hypothetical protein